LMALGAGRHDSEKAVGISLDGEIGQGALADTRRGTGEQSRVRWTGRGSEGDAVRPIWN
jgi:hypothetical protein